MMYIEKNGVRINYNAEGSGDVTLLFVHGAFIDMNYWSKQVEYFRQFYRVITIDLPGHGRSGKNRTVWTMHEFGDDVSALIKVLNLKNVVLIGHSMGGDIILEAAAKCADSVIGFVGVDNFKNAGAPLPDEIQNQADQILAMLKTNFAATSESFARMALLSSLTDEKIAEQVAADFRNMDSTVGLEVISSAFTYHTREKELMNQLKLKMYLVSVDNTPVNEELLQKNAPSGYEIYPVKGTCHYPMLENPDEFNRQLHEIILKIRRT